MHVEGVHIGIILHQIQRGLVLVLLGRDGRRRLIFLDLGELGHGARGRAPPRARAGRRGHARRRDAEEYFFLRTGNAGANTGGRRDGGFGRCGRDDLRHCCR